MIKKTPVYNDETVQAVREEVVDCQTWLEARERIAEFLGIHPDNATRQNRKYAFWGKAGGGDTGGLPVGLEERDVEIRMSKEATLDEVMEACQIDSEKWEAKGFSVRRGAKDYAWNARFSKKPEVIDIEKALSTFAERAEKHAPKKWPVPPKKTAGKADCLYVLNIQDLHLAKLAWAPETGGADWDIRIAEQAYRDAVDQLISKVPTDRVEEVLLIIGSDLLQVDNDKSTTTAGTYVDSDSRLAKAFDVATKMVTDVVEKLAVSFKVKLVVVPGNHDATVSLFVGKYVEAFFRNNPNVSVDSSPKSRKYYGYGKNLIGFDHGDETKLTNLPLLIMRENQSTISQYKFQEVLTGHLHGEQVKEISGIKVRVAPALCANDRWHARRGYVGNLRQSQGLLYNREDGLEAIFYSKPLD
jgi:hypothetical protein